MTGRLGRRAASCYFDHPDDGPFSVPFPEDSYGESHVAAPSDVSATGRVAFEVDSDAPTNIVTTDAKGGDLRDLGAGSAPSWSPDGARIAFNRDGGLFVAAADGSGATAQSRLPILALASA